MTSCWIWTLYTSLAKWLAVLCRCVMRKENPLRVSVYPTVRQILPSFRFSGALSPGEHLPGKAPTAQPTRIDAGHRLFSVPLTRITSVPECAVSSVGFLWDRPPCRRLVGFLWGSQEPLTPGRPAQGIQVLQLLHAVINLRVTQRGRDSLYPRELGPVPNLFHVSPGPRVG